MNRPVRYSRHGEDCEISGTKRMGFFEFTRMPRGICRMEKDTQILPGRVFRQLS